MTNRITDFEDNVTYATAAVLNGEWDNIYTGTIDRTGGRWGSLTDVPVTLGNSQQSQMVFSSANSCLAIGVDTASRRLLICNKGFETSALGLATASHPTIMIHSASTLGAYFSLTHDGTNGVINNSVFGSIVMQIQGTNCASVYTDGMAIFSDKALHLGSSQESKIGFSPANGCLAIGVDITSRTLLVCDKGDETTDFNLSIRTNPSIIVHAADVAAANTYIDYGATRIALSDSNVAHGFTALAETTTYGVLNLIDDNGGLAINGAAEGNNALIIAANVNTYETTKSTAAGGCIYMLGAGRSGTSRGPLGANANIVVIADNDSVKFIFDKEGDAHADVQWTTFDDYDDVTLINDLERGITQGFGEMLTYNKDAVEKAGIAHFYGEPGKAMVNFTRLSMAQCGAIKQLAKRLADLEQRLLPPGE